MTRSHGSLNNDAELDSAYWSATRGAVVGASKWAIVGGIAAGVGQAFSPLYRNLTIQFKVFLQISFMTFGGVVEADRYLRHHGAIMRARKQVARDAKVWKQYEQEYGKGSDAE